MREDWVGSRDERCFVRDPTQTSHVFALLLVFALVIISFCFYQLEAWNRYHRADSRQHKINFLIR